MRRAIISILTVIMLSVMILPVDIAAAKGREGMIPETANQTAIESALVADFDFELPCSICGGEAVQFTDLATGGAEPYQYDWDFGDGNEHSAAQNPEHVYASAQAYNVTLTVTDSIGGVASKTEAVVFDLTAKASAEGDSVINLAAGDRSWPRCNSGCTANDATVIAVWLVPDGDCSPGDGNTAELWARFDVQRAKGPWCIVSVMDVYLDGVLAYDEYTTAIGDLPGKGQYNRKLGDVVWPCGAELEIRDVHVQWHTHNGDLCLWGQCSGYVPSKCWDARGPFYVHRPLIANFEVNSVCFCNNTTFVDTTTGGKKPYTYSWDFGGDYTYSGDEPTELQNPGIHYNEPGIYTVTLNVTDSDCPTNSDSQSYEVIVYPNPTASITPDPAEVYPNIDLQLHGNPSGGSGTYTTHSWTGSGATYLSDTDIENPGFNSCMPGTYSLTYTVTDDNGCVGSDHVTVTVRAPDFTVDTDNYKSVNMTIAQPGDTLSFTIYYKNTGNMDATNVTITDVVDTNLENVTPQDGGTYNATSRTMTWDIGIVAMNVSGTVSFTADIVSPLDDGTVIENFGTIDSGQTEPENTNTTETIIGSAPDFTVDTDNYKAVNMTVAQPGDTLSFTIYYKNTGNMDATNVTITDMVDANLENVTPQDDGSYNATSHTITWNIGTVAANASGTVHFTADIVSPLSDGTIIYNTGTIDSDQTDPEDTNTTQTTVESATPPVTPAGGGGGGSTIKYLTVDWEGNNTTKPLYSNDKLAVDLLGPSPDDIHNLFLERGTHAPVVDETTYYLIIVRELAEIPPLPENTEAIVVFNITPTDAVFDNDIFLTLGLNETQLPGNALNVTMDYYDDVSGAWLPLEYEAGGPNGVAELTFSAPINHFSIYGILAELEPTAPTQPAHFVPSGLSITPNVEKTIFVTTTGETVTITANIANDGGQEGTYDVILKLNGQTVDTKTVTVGAGQSKQVSFTQSGLGYGQYEVEVAGLTGEFTASRAITWWLIILIIVVVGLIMWGIIWDRRRRRKTQQEA